MARECVRGSLTTPVPAIARVDAMIGYESESIECSLFSMMNSSSVDEEGMVCAIDGIGDFNLFSGAPGHSSASGTAMYEQPAPGYLPDTNSKVKPMSQKRMNQIFNTASQMYSGLTEEEQFQLTKVALDVQDMLTLRAGQSVEASTSAGMSALIPTSNRLLKEAKIRKKGRKEVSAEVYTKKLKTSVQRMGLSQTIIGEQHDLQVNGKASARKHCSFCDKDHAVTHCPQRTHWITQKFHEYDLSTNNDNESKLRSVIKHSMPTVTYSTESVFGKIERSLMLKNFIIHKAYHIEGTPINQIESMNFCVDFLGKDGEVLDCSKGMWISGGLMNSLITHNNVKKKYVYDATTVHKTGMRQRGTDYDVGENNNDGQSINYDVPYQGENNDDCQSINYDIPYQGENNNDCQSITSHKSSSSCLSSTIADPFDQNDDGTSTEPIHVGDVIQFYISPYVCGDKRGLVCAEVLAIDPNDSCPLVLSNQYAIAKDGFQLIQRVKVKTPGDRPGFWRLLQNFTIQQEGSTQDAGMRANSLQTKEFGDIMSRRTSLVRELAEKEQFSPMDIMVQFPTTQMGQK